MNVGKHKQSGFTIVELLIVVVVIAILAAITIVAYRGIRDQAEVSSLKSSLSQQAKKLSVWKVQNNEQYPADLTTARAQGMLADTSDTTYVAYIASTSLNNFCVTAQRSNGVKYSVTSVTNTPVVGECVTNIAIDPAATAISNTTNTAPVWSAYRWWGSSGAGGTYTSITGASDGVAGLTTYLRKQWTAVTSNGDLGFDHTPNGASTISSSTLGVVVQPDTTYTFSSYLRSSATYMGAQIHVYWHDASGASLGSVASTRTSIAPGSWFRASLTTTSPSTAAKMGFVSDLDNQVPTVNMTLDGTGLMVTQGSTLYNYADGNSANWFWNGTPNASTSTGPAVAQ